MTTSTRNRARQSSTLDYTEHLNAQYDKVHQLRIEHKGQVYRETVTHQHETGEWLHTLYIRQADWTTSFDVEVVSLAGAEAIIDRLRSRGRNTA